MAQADYADSAAHAALREHSVAPAVYFDPPPSLAAASGHKRSMCLSIRYRLFHGSISTSVRAWTEDGAGGPVFHPRPAGDAGVPRFFHCFDGALHA